MGKRKQRTQAYPEEFRQDAIRLVTEEGRTVADVARQLGLGPTTLHGWLRASKKQKPASSPSAEEEVKLLRKKVRRLEMEKEILKKAAAFFAKEMT